MTTELKKPIKRRTMERVRDGGKPRRLVVTLYPTGFIGLRQEGRRKEETVTIEGVYQYAIRNRLAVERMEKAKAKKAKREGR